MNIWFLTNEFPPFFGGGIATYVDSVSKMFASAGHQATVFVQDDNRSSIEESGNLRIIRFLKDTSLYQRLPFAVALSYQIAQVVIQQAKISGAPDIIEVQDSMGLGHYLLQYKLLGEKVLEKVPVTILLHTPMFAMQKANKIPQYRLNEYMLGFQERSSFAAASGFICPSKFLYDNLQNDLPDKPIEVIPLPLPCFEDTSNQPIKNKNLNNLDKIDFLFFGRFEYRKGIDQFLETAANLWEEGHNFRLVAVGSDYLFAPKGYLVKDKISHLYAKHLNDSRLIVLDSQPPGIIQSLIKKASFVIVPSTFENFPYTCMEAMSLRTPVIASASGGQSEMVGQDNLNGMVFDWNDPVSLQNVLQKALSLSTKQISALGTNAQKRIKKYCDPVKIVEQRIRFYEKLIRTEKTGRVFPFFSITDKAPVLSKDKNNLLSIVLPVRNNALQLNKAIKSIDSNTYQEKEIILVDNESHDEQTLESIKALKNRSDTRVVRTDVITSPAGINSIGISEAAGGFISFYASSYTLSERYYEKAIETLVRFTNVGFAYSWQQFIDINNYHNTFVSQNSEMPLMLTNNVLSPNIVYRKYLIKEIVSPENPSYGYEDQFYCFQLLLEKIGGVCIPEELMRCHNLKAFNNFSLFAGKLPSRLVVQYKTVFASDHARIDKPTKIELLKLLQATHLSRGV